MRTPNPILEDKSKETFASVHERMRRKANTGTVELGGSRIDGGAVFLNGAVVYALYGDQKSEDAVESLLSKEANGVRASLSDPEKVRMFVTYLRYISDDGVLTAEPLDGATVESHDIEGVLIDGVRNEPEGSWRGQTNPVDRTIFPEGKRTALAPDLVSLREHVSENDVSGYAVGKGGVVTFRNGGFIDKRRIEVSPSVRTDVGAGGGWVVVDSDATVEENEDDDGILSRFF